MSALPVPNQSGDRCALRLSLTIAVGLVLVATLVVISVGFAMTAAASPDSTTADSTTADSTTVDSTTADSTTVDSTTADSTAADDDAVAYLVTNDLVVGESTQTLGPMRVAQVDAGEEVVVEIDLAALRDRGVDVSDASVTLDDDDVDAATLTDATVSDSTVRLVFEAEDRGFAVGEFQLVDLDTDDASGAEDVTFAGSLSHGEFDAEAFTIVHPDDTTPLVDPRDLSIELDSQVVHIENVQPEADEFILELDVTVLESHDIGVGDLSVDAAADGGTVVSTAVDDGIVTITVVPDDVPLVDLRLELSAFDTDMVADHDEVVLTEDVTYDASIEGDADESVLVEPFAVIVQTPTPHEHSPPETGNDGTPVERPAYGDDRTPDDDDTLVTDDNASLGPLVPLVALLVTALLFARRRES